MPKVRFTTCIKKYSFNWEPIVVSIKYGPTELSNIVKSLLKEENVDAKNVNFRFSVDDKLIKESIGDFIEINNLSQEFEEISFDVELEKPKLDRESKLEQFANQIKSRSGWLAVAALDLQIFDMGHAGEGPVVHHTPDRDIYKIDWVELDEDKREAIVMTTGEWSTVQMWACDLETGTAKVIFDFLGHEKDAAALSVSSKRNLVATGSEDGLMKIWSTDRKDTTLIEETGGIPHKSKRPNKVPTKIPIVTLSAHNSHICTVQWLESPWTLPGSSSSGDLLSCGNDWFLKLWHIDSQRSSLIREVKADYFIRSMSANCANHLILAGGADTRLRCYDLRADMALVQSVHMAHTGSITSFNWSPINTNVFLTAGRDGATKLWDVRFINKAIDVVAKFPQAVACCDWSSDGQWLTTSYDDGSLRFYKFVI